MKKPKKNSPKFSNNHSNLPNDHITFTKEAQRQPGSRFFQILLSLTLFILLFVTSAFIGYKPFLKKQQASKPEATIAEKEDASDWKTYINETYSFSLKYPHGYIYESLGPNYFQQLLDKGEMISGTVPPSFDTITFQNENNRILVEIFHQVGGSIQKNYDFTIDGACGSQFADATYDDRVVTIGTLKTRYRTQKEGEKLQIYYCLLNNTNNLITISASTTPENKNSTDKLLNQILSTFKFLPDTTDWKTYTDSDLQLSFNYPQGFSINEGQKSLILTSPSYMCRVKGHDTEMEKTSEITFDVTLHEGKSFAQSWLDAFGFEFKEENTYDGTEIIGDKKTYYFYQGAEMSFGRKAMLVEISSDTSLEINAYTPSYMFECSDHVGFTTNTKYTNTVNQILSTYKFLDSQVDLKPTGSQNPVAGICLDATSGKEVITATINIDNIPSPRCVMATSNQKLKIINNSSSAQSVNLGTYKTTIDPGGSYEFPENLGAYLGKGVHSTGGPEIWIQ